MPRTLLISALMTGLAAATPLARQVPQAQSNLPVGPVDTQPEVEQLKMQVRNFEAILRSAVESGGRRLQKRAEEVMPVAPVLALASDPVVMGTPHPDGGLVFWVQVPDLMQSGLQVWRMMQQRGGTPVSMPASFDPNREYAEYVREALIESMLENSQALRVADGGELVIVASVTEAVRRSSLDSSRLLSLSIKGADLAAYREHKLTKDEVKQRVVDRRF